MIQYVAGFMFSPNFKNVLLIEKNKPKWQEGKYNAIGGKIEADETAVSAMVREFREECGLDTEEKDWNLYCCISGDGYKVYFYWATSEIWSGYESKTTEEVFDLYVDHLYEVRGKLIKNLKWLIPLAIDKANSYSGNIELNPQL